MLLFGLLVALAHSGHDSVTGPPPMVVQTDAPIGSVSSALALPCILPPRAVWSGGFVVSCTPNTHTRTWTVLEWRS